MTYVYTLVRTQTEKKHTFYIKLLPILCALRKNSMEMKHDEKKITNKENSSKHKAKIYSTTATATTTKSSK